MVILRATQKVLRRLPASAEAGQVSDTALGDWYVNRIVVDRRPLLLLVSEKSLLITLTPAREVKKLPERLPGLIFDRLKRFGTPLELIEAEMDAMAKVRVGPTKDRSVTGQMVELAKMLPYSLPENAWDERHLRLAEDDLAEMPCGTSRSLRDSFFPKDRVSEVLRARWQVR